MKLHSSDGISVENTLHHALGPFLVVARFIGVLPVSSIWPTYNVAHVHFHWCSIGMLLTLFLLAFTCGNAISLASATFTEGFKLYKSGAFTFSIVCLLAYVNFLILARHWPKLIKQTRRCEMIFLQKSYETKVSKNFSKNLRLFGTIFLIAALGEHSTYLFSALYNNYEQLQKCNISLGFWENIFEQEGLQILKYFKYQVWHVPVNECIILAMTFTWNFSDIFLSLIFRSLTIRFHQIHTRIRRYTNQLMPLEFWSEIRQDFLTLTELLWQYDKKLSNLVLLSCAHNLYYICVQIFHIFLDKGNFANEIYFWCSLIYVTSRLLIMMFSAAAIPDAANLILATLYEIPTSNWCLELKRLNEILISDLIALSGKGFFFLTRSLIFAMVGTVLIYELVLVDSIEEARDDSNICTSGRVRTF